MAKTTVRSGQVRNIDLQVEDLKDFGVVDAGGLNVTVTSGRVRDDNTVTDKSDQALALTDNATNFVEITVLGVASSNTSAFTANSIPVAQVVTSGADISSITDKRSWFHSGAGGGDSNEGSLGTSLKSQWVTELTRAIQEDQSATRVANSAGDMIVDVISDSSGIDGALSSNQEVRGSPNFDVIALEGASIDLFRPSDLTSGLQGFWKLDETSGSRADSSGNGNTLADNATVTSDDHDYWNTSEKSASFAKANLEFLSIVDGSQTGLELAASNFTLAGWVNPGTIATNNHNIWSKWDTVNGYNVKLTANVGTLETQIEGSGSFTSNTALKANRWYHVILTFDNSTKDVTYFINGNIDKVGNLAVTVTDNSNDFRLGARSTAADYYDGLMKDAAVWNRVLTPIEIKSLALGINLTTTSFRPDNSSLTSPTAYWKLNEVSGGTGAISRADSSGNGHTLTDVNTVESGNGYFEGTSAKFTLSNSERLTAPHSVDFDLGTDVDFSISFWINFAERTTTRFIIGEQGSSLGWVAYIQPTVGTMLMTSQATSHTSGTGNGIWNVGTWYHAAYIKSGSSLTFYRDGIQYGNVANTVAGFSFNANSGIPFSIGENSGIFMGANLQDVALYKGTAITSANVASLASGLTLQQAGLVSYWKLDESSGTRIDAIGSNDLLDNNTVLSASGQVGTAGDFDRAANEFLRISDASQSGLDLATSSFSLLTWHKRETLSFFNMYLINKTVGGSGYSLHMGGPRNGAFQFQFNNGATMNLTSAAADDVSTSVFAHTVCIWDGAEGHIYIDSRLSSSVTNSTPPNDGAEPFSLGTRPAGGNWDGLMDETIIAARHFREEEIKTVYNKGFNGKEATSIEVSLGSSPATVISNAITLSEVPTDALVIANTTLNSGTITIYVSRKASPGSDLTVVADWKPILVNTITDITAVDSGSSGRWAVAITGDAELDDIAVIFGKATA